MPAYFNDAQREATKTAGKIAGLNVLKILSEPVAAALAFGQSTIEDEENILVYDLGKNKHFYNSKIDFQLFIHFVFLFFSISGGGTFDTAIVTIDSMGMHDVRSTNGNTRLGGAKFNDALMRLCIKKAKIDLMLDKEQISAIRASCEEGKKILSSCDKAEILIGTESIEVTRKEFETLIAPYVEETAKCVKDALLDSDLQIEEIHKVLLVGGGTYTPIIRDKLESIFGKKVDTSINPMEAG